eukprot:247694-Lingulodinium_polyedra.AAC.1
MAIIEQRLLCLSWYARVPSAANVADGPSRDEFSRLEEMGSVRVTPVFPTEWSPGSGRPPSFAMSWHWE